MNRIISIQKKAAFLLLVFALNTIVGFACSLGVDMGFNTKHHNEITAPAIHVHADGKKHIHEKKKHSHTHGKKHTHGHEKKKPHDNNSKHHHEEANNKPGDDKDNCCRNEVLKFSELDKSVAKTFFHTNPVFFTAFLSLFYSTNILLTSEGTTEIKYFVRNYHPPIPDIRIAIQSFQI